MFFWKSGTSYYICAKLDTIVSGHIRKFLSPFVWPREEYFQSFQSFKNLQNIKDNSPSFGFAIQELSSEEAN